MKRTKVLLCEEGCEHVEENCIVGHGSEMCEKFSIEEMNVYDVVEVTCIVLQ